MAHDEDFQLYIKQEIEKGLEEGKTPYGYCQCGCGKKTKLITENDKPRGRIKGNFNKFIVGHNFKLFKAESGKNHHCYKENIKTRRKITKNKQRKLLYRDIVENLIGFNLPANAIIHHIDNNHFNNSKTNFVVCENEAYHQLLHRRQKAYHATGNANYRWCQFCKSYDDPPNMHVGKHSAYHSDCWNKYKRDKRYEKKNHSRNTIEKVSHTVIKIS